MTTQSKVLVCTVLALVCLFTLTLGSSYAGSGCCPALAAKNTDTGTAAVRGKCPGLAGKSYAGVQGCKYEQTLLGAYMGMADAQIQAVLQNLRLLAHTEEVKSGKWEDMKELIMAYQKDNPTILPFYSHADGTYYTAKVGKTDKNLKDRDYFPALIEGKEVVGNIVVGKTSGKKSAIVGVPVFVDGRVQGALGTAIFVEDLTEMIGKAMPLPGAVTVFAITSDNSVAMCSRQTPGKAPACGGAKPTTPCEKACATPCPAAGKQGGVYYQTSALTGWRFGIGGCK